MKGLGSGVQYVRKWGEGSWSWGGWCREVMEGVFCPWTKSVKGSGHWWLAGLTGDRWDVFSDSCSPTPSSALGIPAEVSAAAKRRKMVLWQLPLFLNLRCNLMLMLKDTSQERHMCCFSNSLRNNLSIILQMMKGNAKLRSLLNAEVWQSSVPASS